MKTDLFCPRCAQPFDSGTKFCRTCGLALDGVSEIVNGEAANAPEVKWQPNFKLMRIGIGLFILGLVIALSNAALRDLGLFPESYGKMLFLALAALGMLMLGAGFVFPTRKYTKRKSSNIAAPDLFLDTAPLAGELGAAKTDLNELEFRKDGRDLEAIPVGSVTEHTTRNLEPETK